MELQQLFAVASAYGAEVYLADDELAQAEVTGIAYDSRKVKTGFLFVAIAGGTADGHQYIDAAIRAGAIAVVANERPAGLPDQIGLIMTENSRRLLGKLAAAYYGQPEQELRLIGVTGTNGKTTTTHLIKFLLESTGTKTGLIGTVYNQAGDHILPSTHTTPESLELFELFGHMRGAGCRAVVMEASSHALSQGRTDSCSFNGAVFTNLTQDHLDYHGSMEAYLASKLLLFSALKNNALYPAYAVINLDDTFADYFIKASHAPVWTYGSHQQADLRLMDYQISSEGSSFSLRYKDKIYDVKIPLIGKFNIYNALAALTSIAAEGLDMVECIQAIKNAPQVPGRFELVQAGQDFTVAVDYAHTPDGLENVLSAARELKPKYLICVFGCGGDRDNSKRPLMGRIGAQLSDLAIITTDNPRFEDPAQIIAQIEAGIEPGKDHYLIEPKRALAIKKALEMAQPGSLVLIAGKGHEDYQIIQGVKHHFDDREQARAVLAKVLLRSSLAGS